jgi:flagellar biosynthesis protein FlhA
MSDKNKLTGNSFLQMIKEPTMIFAVFLIVIVLMLIIPIPAFLLDVLISFNLIIGLLVILTVAYLKRAVDFSIFPSVLLASTLFRLSVNVSASRLILREGPEFDGKMIRAFGNFVVGSSDMAGLVIGIIIFAILVIVQFIVITRGATRVAEVAARFSLDSMPNKYMAIDMDVQNGIIDEADAIKRRSELQEESSFYGNMDGATKFVQGDVIVGIIVIFVNIIGGFSVGMLIRGESFELALTNYISLTIGDGLVNQIPSLLISTATGLIVTRSQAKDSIGTVVWDQITKYSRIFFVAGALMAILALLPGFPHIILLMFAAGMAAAGYALYTSEQKDKKDKTVKKDEKSAEEKGPENVASLLKVDPLSLYIGYELIPLVDKAKGAELLSSITGIRRSLALEMGIVVPPIRIQDNMRLMPNEYSFKIRGQEIGKGLVKVGYLMAMGEGTEPIEGEETTEPAFGMPARWIKEELREKAEGLGYTVVDPPTIISTHIQELLKEHSFEIVGREEVNQIIETMKKDYPNIVDDVLADFKKAFIQKILEELLKEGVSIRDMPTILETLSDHSSQTPLYELIEYVRQGLKRAICNKYMDNESRIHVIRLHPKIENEIYRNMTAGGDGFPSISLKPDLVHNLQNTIKNKIKEMFDRGYPPVILCQPPVRRAIWEICRNVNRNIGVISTREIVPKVELVLFGQVELEEKVAEGAKA